MKKDKSKRAEDLTGIKRQAVACIRGNLPGSESPTFHRERYFKQAKAKLKNKKKK